MRALRIVRGVVIVLVAAPVGFAMVMVFLSIIGYAHLYGGSNPGGDLGLLGSLPWCGWRAHSGWFCYAR